MAEEHPTTVDDTGAVAQDAILTGGLQILGGTMPIEGGPNDGLRVPVVAFRFHAKDGRGVYPDIILAVEKTELRGLYSTIRSAGEAAIREADAKNPKRPRSPKRR